MCSNATILKLRQCCCEEQHEQGKTKENKNLGVFEMSSVLDVKFWWICRLGGNFCPN